MATLFTTGFEDYADGEQSLLDHGWTGPVVPGLGQRCQVVSSSAHAGSKSCRMGNTPSTDVAQQLARTIAPATQSVSAEAWFTKPNLTGLFQLMLYHSSNGGALYVQAYSNTTVNGGAGVATYTPIGGVLDQVNGLLTTNTYYDLKLHIYMSSVNVTLDGINSDGCISVWLDGTEIIALTGQDVTVTDSGWASGLNYPPDRFQIGAQGWIDDVTLTDDVMTCPTAVLQIQGSAVFGMNTTVTATRAIAFGVDGATNVHGTSGMVRVFGDLEVTGTPSGGASISAFLDGLGT